MNCKQGDLALVVYAPVTPELIGHYVICVRRHQAGEAVDGRLIVEDGNPAWVVESASGALLPSRSQDGELHLFKKRVFNDLCLRPIRDQPGEDETLTWKDVPSKVTA